MGRLSLWIGLIVIAEASDAFESSKNVYNIYSHGAPRSKKPNRFVSSSHSEQLLDEDVAVVSPSSSPSSLYKAEEYEDYSRFLSVKDETKERAVVLSELEASSETRLPSRFSKMLRKPLKAFAKRFLLPTKVTPGQLILVRCGESEADIDGLFTGWLDSDLTPRGIEECKNVARVLLAEGFDPDLVYTSRLTRGVKSVWAILEELQALFLPVHKTYRLNPRMDGMLQGLSKEQAAAYLGGDAVRAWMHSQKAKPPPLSFDDPAHPIHDRRYSDLSESQLPTTESVLDCQERARPLWEYKIRKDLQAGKTVLVVAHRDTLRGFIKNIDRLSGEKVSKVAIPKGLAMVYRFDEQMNPTPPEDDSLGHQLTSFQFLGKPSKIKAALQKQDLWENGTIETDEKMKGTLRESLRKLRHVNDDDLALSHDDSYEGGSMMNYTQSTPTQAAYNGVNGKTRNVERFEEYDDEHDTSLDNNVKGATDVNVVSLPKTQLQQNKRYCEGEALVVLVRHGRTPHNNMGLFTGWEDPPLAPDGVEDARRAGRLFKRHGVEFDVVYSSWLIRSIQTAYYILEELDCVWLPIVKSWRLNERMYGALTGKSKKMIANEHGEAQLKKWRRGYTIRPPPASSYSHSYPGNDSRRAKHYKDLRVSWRETINRSIEQRKLVIHRRFPKTESLKDCMDRSIPFYTEKIREEAVDKGKHVLIASHENAMRGILMHLFNIPIEAMSQLHIPNGLPLVYNVKQKCITLLDDGSGQDPMSVHDFGPAAKYLFKSCELEEEEEAIVDALS